MSGPLRPCRAAARGLTALYDPAMALTMRETTWRERFTEQVLEGLRTGASVIDVGAGTGTFAAMLAARRPDVTDHGRRRGRRGARPRGAQGRAGARRGLAGDLPLDDDAADRVTMSLLLHHLTSDAKRPALRRGAARSSARAGACTSPTGAAPTTRSCAPPSSGLQLLDGFAPTRDHAAGRVPGLVAAAGFGSVTVGERYRTVFGSLELITAG